jgi:hypothetical protein
VLDRSADIYAYDIDHEEWTTERYDRPVGDASAHYYVALAATSNGLYLAETDYHLAIHHADGQNDYILPLPDHSQVDIDYADENTYVLSQIPGDILGRLISDRNGVVAENFAPQIQFIRPRQIQVSGG